MRELLAPFAAIIRRDFRREARTGELLLGGAGFGIVTILAYAFSRSSVLLDAEAGIGALWLAIIFASQVAIAGSVETEGSAGRLDAIRATGVDAGVYYLGKSLSLFMALLFFASGLLAVTTFLFNLEVSALTRVLPVLVAGIGGIALSGPLIVLLGAGARSAKVLTPFLYVVLFVPLLLSCVMASRAAIDGEILSDSFSVVAAYDLIMGGGALLVAPVILEES